MCAYIYTYKPVDSDTRAGTTRIKLWEPVDEWTVNYLRSEASGENVAWNQRRADSTATQDDFR